MSDEDAFRAAIEANPLDDLPSFVYADWLQERGREDEAVAIREALRFKDELQQSAQWVADILQEEYPTRGWVRLGPVDVRLVGEGRFITRAFDMIGREFGPLTGVTPDGMEVTVSRVRLDDARHHVDSQRYEYRARATGPIIHRPIV